MLQSIPKDLHPTTAHPVGQDFGAMKDRLEILDHPAVVYHAEGHVLYANPASDAWLGWSPVGDLALPMHPEDGRETRTRLAAAWANGAASIMGHTRLRHASGVWLRCAYFASLVSLEGEHYVVVMCQPTVQVAAVLELDGFGGGHVVIRQERDGRFSAAAVKELSLSEVRALEDLGQLRLVTEDVRGLWARIRSGCRWGMLKLLP